MAWYNTALSLATGIGAGLVTMNPMVGLAAYGGAQALQNGIADATGGSGAVGPTGAAAAPVGLGHVAPTVIGANAPTVNPNVGSGNRIGGDAAAAPSQAQQVYSQQLNQSAAASAALNAPLAEQTQQNAALQDQLKRAQAAANILSMQAQLQQYQAQAQVPGVTGSIAAAHVQVAQRALDQAVQQSGMNPSEIQKYATMLPSITQQYQESQTKLQQLQSAKDSYEKQIQQTGAQYHDQVAKDNGDPARLANMQLAAENRTGPTLDRTSVDPNAGAADMGRYLDDRGQVTSLAGALAQTAYGTGGPSVAELQLQKGQQANHDAALSIANSQRGGGGTLGTLEALRANATNDAKTNQDAAILRADEQLKARTTLGNVLNAQGSSDLAARTGTMTQANAVTDREITQNATGYNGQITARGQNDALATNYLNQYMTATGRPQDVAIANQNAAVNTQGQVINANVGYGAQAAGVNTATLNSGTNLATAQMTAEQQAAQLAEQKRKADQARTDQYISAGINAAGTYMAGNATTPKATTGTGTPTEANPWG